ncbi:MAG: chlorite dismutase family protein [Methylococcales bacterium]
MASRLFTFTGGNAGPWRVTRTNALIGESLPYASRLDIVAGPGALFQPGAAWVLRGITSNERYVTRPEKGQLVAKQQGVGRPESTSAALIPIRKNPDWWALTQDERRNLFEEQSKHIKIGLEYLPAVARRLYHCRDLSQDEPFDFMTYFEYAPAHEADFHNLLAELRASQEWKFVEREVDVRLGACPRTRVCKISPLYVVVYEHNRHYILWFIFPVLYSRTAS